MVEFRSFVNRLEDLYEFKINKVLLEDIGYGSKAEFSMDKCGHIQISGEIFDYAMEQSLKFLFSADQSSLKVFIDQLRKLADV